MTVNRLDGRKVLITRPAGQGENLASLVRQAGGEPVVLPLLQIELNADPAILLALTDPEDLPALIIFVSIHAVAAIDSVNGQRIPFHESTQLAAIGPATAAALRLGGYNVDFEPASLSNSEVLLEMLAGLSLNNQRVIIVRGQQGRELLAQRLRQSGARVSKIEAYRRVAIEDPPLHKLEYWLADRRGILTLTSVDILQRLLQHTPQRLHSRLKQRSVVAFSQRIADACQQQGFSGKINVAAKSSDAGIMQALADSLCC